MKQGEIWLVNLDPAIGSEIKKKRPCIILNDDAIGILPLKIIAPLTGFKDKFKIVPWMVIIKSDNFNNINKNSVVDCFQVRSVAEQRLIGKIGFITHEQLKRIQQALKVVFSIT